MWKLLALVLIGMFVIDILVDYFNNKLYEHSIRAFIDRFAYALMVLYFYRLIN